MRVIAGKARRLSLITPKGQGTRPTTDIIKETLFNMIQNDLDDIRFLDLFAGSGGIGIEALSRGARECVFVDSDREAVRCIYANLEHTKLISQAKVLGYDYKKALRRLRGSGQFDMIFMDPPYSEHLESEALDLISDYELLKNDGTVIIEMTKEGQINALPEDFIIKREKIYKSNKHIFIGKETVS